MKTMIDVEYEASGIELYVRNKYGLDDNWFGDCYPEEIKHIETMMFCADDEQTYKQLVELLEEVFDEMARNAKGE